jgi:purine-nucleoside phosphorylase
VSGLLEKTIGFEEVSTAADFIRNRLKIKENAKAASVAVVLGSGLGTFAQEVIEKSKTQVIPYHDIPYFPTSSIEGHSSCLVYGFIDETPVLLMQGRVHRYEGYAAQKVVFPICVLQSLGIKSVVLTNAAGAIGDHLDVGDLMLIQDHINMTGDNPLLGPNDFRMGPRFFDMSEAYSKSLRDLAHKVAINQNAPLKEGVYIGVLGPCYETPAEIGMFKSMGADAVGMSTVFETISARHGNIDVLGISCLTNKAAGLSVGALNHQEVTEIATKVSKRFSNLLFGIIPEIAHRYEYQK